MHTQFVFINPKGRGTDFFSVELVVGGKKLSNFAEDCEVLEEAAQGSGRATNSGFSVFKRQ